MAAASMARRIRDEWPLQADDADDGLNSDVDNDVQVVAAASKATRSSSGVVTRFEQGFGQLRENNSAAIFGFSSENIEADSDGKP